jgi:hypothetical protein
MGRVTQTACDLVHTQVDFSAPRTLPKFPDFAIRHMIARFAEVPSQRYLRSSRLSVFHRSRTSRIKMSRQANGWFRRVSANTSHLTKVG